MGLEPSYPPNVSGQKPRSDFSHYLPRLKREFYQADAVIFWTMPVSHRQQGWLTDSFHAAFREVMLHAAAREGLVCPAYCLMSDHIHLVWMGLRRDTDQRNGIKFLRAQIGPFLKPAKFQHQAHDHVLTAKERQRHAFGIACAELCPSQSAEGWTGQVAGDLAVSRCGDTWLSARESI